MVGRRLKIRVYKFNFTVNPNGCKDSSGNGIKKGFSQFPVVFAGNHRRIYRFDVLPDLLILYAAHQQVFYAALDVIDDILV